MRDKKAKINVQARKADRTKEFKCYSNNKKEFEKYVQRKRERMNVCTCVRKCVSKIVMKKKKVMKERKEKGRILDEEAFTEGAA
jgi:hypothetical protein